MWVSSSAHVAHRSMFYPTFLCRGPGAHAACRELVDAWEIRCTFILGTLTTPRAYQKCVVSIATTTTTTTTCGGLSPAYVSLVAGRPPLVSLCHVNCRLCVCVCVFMWNCSYNYNYNYNCNCSYNFMWTIAATTTAATTTTTNCEYRPAD
jgi:hypothetical protein